MKTFNTVKKYIGAGVTGAVALVASASSWATGESAITGAINTAVASGQANYGLVVVGLIVLCALGFGLRSITGAMKG